MNSRLVFFIALQCIFCSTLAQSFENIQIDIQGESGYPPCEPSIVINPKKPNQIIGGAILDKVYLSNDSGKTWTVEKLTSSMGVFGDPCIVSDIKGNYYYLHLSNPSGKGWSDDSILDRIVCQYSKNGKRWTDGSGIGLNGAKDQDKEWAVVNPETREIYATWTQFDKYNSKELGDSTIILFSKSKKGGKKFSEPVRISAIAGDCLDDDETTEGAVPAVGANGEIYVAWALNESIYFDKSLDGGLTWLDEDILAGNIVGGWAQSIPGINRCNGMPVVKVDLSGGLNHGRIYINYTDQTNGENDTDVWIIYSDNQGETWSKPIRVNQDKTQSHQFFTWMDIDQSTGCIYAVYYDRRNHSDNLTDVYLSVSKDGGDTYSDFLVSETPFEPVSNVFFGDYNNISAVKGVIRPIWTRYENGKLSVWTALISEENLSQ